MRNSVTINNGVVVINVAVSRLHYRAKGRSTVVCTEHAAITMFTPVCWHSLVADADPLRWQHGAGNMVASEVVVVPMSSLRTVDAVVGFLHMITGIVPTALRYSSIVRVNKQ
jgi:hypothetical protein